MPIQTNPAAEEFLYTRIGAALWQIQSFENALAHYLCIRFNLEPGVSMEEAQGILRKTAKKTLGGLLQDLRTNAGATSELEQRLACFVDERNWLVHRIRAENHTDMYNRDKFVELTQRIDAVGEEAVALARVVLQLLVAYGISQGISMREVEAEAIEKPASVGHDNLAMCDTYMTHSGDQNQCC